MPKRIARKTKRIIGEGQTEKAFLLFLRANFSTGKIKITPKSAGGKGPHNVLGEAISECKQKRYDNFCAFLDSDIAIPPKLLQECKKKNITVILNEPCIEATFLKIKGIKCNNLNTQACKKLFIKEFGEIPTDANSMNKLFTVEEIEAAAKTIESIKSILKEFK